MQVITIEFQDKEILEHSCGMEKDRGMTELYFDILNRKFTLNFGAE